MERLEDDESKSIGKRWNSRQNIPLSRFTFYKLFKFSFFDPKFSVTGIQPRIGELAVFAVSFLCYSVTLAGSFVFDDTEAVVNNMDVKGPDFSLARLFVNDFWGTSLEHKASHKSYRPLTVLTFRCRIFFQFQFE